ncbi:hypothetical protein Tco_0003719 [Tanacetum coccineum]
MNELVNDGIKLSKLEINTGFINGLPKKWLDFCQSLRNTNQVKESELASLFGKLKYEENLINNIYDTNKEKTLVPATPLSTAFFSTSILQDSQDSLDDEEDTRSSQEYMNDLEEEYQARSLLAKSKMFFKKALVPQIPVRPQAKKGLITESYDWDEEEVSSDDNEVPGVKALMALADEERVSVSNGEWIKISMKKVHTLLEIEYNDDRKSFLDYLCIDLNYVEEQRNNLMSKHRNLAQELNTCKEQLLVLKQAKLDLLTMQHHPLPPLEKLTGAEPVSGPKTIKSILKSKSTFKAETLKGIIINEPSSAPARGNKSSSASKTNSAPAGKLKNVKMEDDPPLAIVMKELNELKLQISKNKSSYFRNKNSQQVPPNALQNKYKTQFKMNCELCGQNNHLSENCYEVLFCKKCKRTNHRTCDHAEFMSSMNINQYHTGQGESSSRSRPSRPAIPFPSCIHCGYNDHKSDDCVYYPICEICGSYDHDTHGHNRIISLRRGIKPRNPQYVTKNCEPCGSNVHTKSDHNDIEVVSGKSGRGSESAGERRAGENGGRGERASTYFKDFAAQIWDVSGPEGMCGNNSTYITEGYGYGIVFKKGRKVNVPQHEH